MKKHHLALLLGLYTLPITILGALIATRSPHTAAPTTNQPTYQFPNILEDLENHPAFTADPEPSIEELQSMVEQEVNEQAAKFAQNS